ncbi:MAG: single-stranded DNA-binding protein [Phycisphaerales bacterium]|nr:single-stranded DNA-binding protein [Phycisphaerales bacterium]MDB5302621.1 single-stranded DNA-binding protein [Phycisphaerales bacterium]
MASFNKVLLMGNLTRDPQLKYLPSQTAVAEFGVACNRKFKTAQGEEREEVTFVDVTAFGKTGEIINQYFTKGKPIFIEGRLKYDQWEDKQGGGKRSKLTVVVDNFQFIGGRDGGGGGGGAGGGGHSQSYEGDGGGEEQRPAQRQAPARPAPPRPAAKPAPAAEPPFGEEQQFKDDDIPF